jgi:hypothetical protein
MAHKIINGITGMLFFSVLLLVSCSSPTGSDFNFPGQGITWRTGTGNRSGGSFTGYITGYYYNIYNQQVDVVISFNGTVSGTTGNGTFSQTVTNGSVSASCSGTTVFSKL